MAEAMTLDALYTAAEGHQDTPEDAQEPMRDEEIVQAVLRYKREAEDARDYRDILSDRNLEAYYSRLARDSEVEGQSNEFLPKVALGVDQTSAIINRGLTGYGQWFSVDLQRDDPANPALLSGEAIEKLLRKHLEPQQSPMGETPSFPTVVTDASKVGLLQSLCILKIWGEQVPSKRLAITPVPIFGGDTGDEVVGQREHLTLVATPQWRLRVSLVRPKDAYIDPSGSNLYFLEASERDWHEVLADAQGDNPMYDLEVVQRMKMDSRDQEREADMARETNTPAPTGVARRKVQLLECWGTILDAEGEVQHENVVYTIANEKYLIRRPTINPYWHQRAPYVVCPLMRVPFTIWHKAIYDDVVDLNLTLNEIFNLLVDGGIASAWNTRQTHMNHIKNSADFTAGIPPGATIIPNDDVPPGTPLILPIRTGEVPQDGMAMYALIDKELQSASMANDIRLGQVPQGRTTATAVSAAQEQGSLFFESIIFNLEHNLIQPALWMAWLVILQHADDWMRPETANLIGKPMAESLARMSPAQRYATYAEDARFRVYGISSVLARQKEFQKILALLQVAGANPDVMAEVKKNVNFKKLLDRIFQALNMDPDQLMFSDQEKQERAQVLQQQQMAQMSQMFGGIQGGAPPGAGGGPAPREPGTAEVLREAQQQRTVGPQGPGGMG